MVCDGMPDEDCLKGRIEDRLLAEPRMRQRIEWPHVSWARPRWEEDESFRLDRHFCRPGRDDDPSIDSLPAVLSQLRSTPLDESLPLWQIHLTRLRDDRTAVVFRLHAAVADARGALDLALGLTDGTPRKEGRESADEPGTLASPQQILRHSTLEMSRTRVLSGLIACRSDRDNPFRCSPSGTRAFAWSEPLEMKGLRSAARRRDATTVELLITGIVGALRLALHRQDLPAEDVSLRAVVPISLRQGSEAPTSTRLALGLLALPLQSPSPRDRLGDVQKAIQALRQESGGMAILGPEPARGWSMTDLEERFLDLLGRKASIMLSLDTAAIASTELCGSQVADILWWPAEIADIALGISALVYDDRVRFAVSADTALPVDAAELAAGMAAAGVALQEG